MSLPNYLARIKSSGIYRFVWDKSVVPTQVAETLRLVVGYSEKGPFNTPVYVDNIADFINIYGATSKKMERKGIYFNRMAIQALAGGPILALNLKPFKDETVNYLPFDPSGMLSLNDTAAASTLKVSELYDTNRFWTLDADQLPEKTKTTKYAVISATDVKDTACTLFCRPARPKAFNITISDWYSNEGLDMPPYLETIKDQPLSDYFMDIYVFRGKFTKELVGEASGSSLSRYFTVSDNTVTLKPTVKNAYNEDVDALDALADDGNSNFLKSYTGCLIPYFKDANGKYISIDVLFNDDYSTHKLMMKLNEAVLEESEGVDGILRCDLAGTSYWQKKTVGGGYVKLGDKPSGSADIAVVPIMDDPNNVKDNDHNVKYVVYDRVDPKSRKVTKEYYEWKDKLGYVYVDALPHGTVPTPKNSIPENPTADNDKFPEFISYKTGGVSTALNPIFVNGYDYKAVNGPDGKMLTGAKLQEAVLNVLLDKGIRTALTNRVDVDYRYIVDTFQSYIEMGCKSKVAAIAREKDNAFAILNFPPISAFLADANFKGGDGKFDMSLVADPSKGFSLASEANGASWCGYFTNVKFSDGTVKANVPSAALVSNNFMEKYGARQPYYIVAGPNYGRINYDGMVGPDYNYGRSDLDVLEPLGVNAIIYVPRKGTFINSNQTAKQVPVSGLSKIHIRELVIYLQDEIEAMLQDYQWELNTQALRDTIKSKADTICERVMNNGGLYAFNNVCDASNNPPEVIDNEMIILDTAIEPARGAGKMVQQLTIHKTGGITSK